MSIYPGAIWEPVAVWPGHGSNGKMDSFTGIVLHCNDAESGDLHDFITGSLGGPNPVSCHFQVLADGTVYQYIDTSVSSWCQGNGNDDYLSIESQGLAGELATPAQIAAIGGILAWAHTTHGIPLQLANAPGERGLGYHGMGAAVGWGHAVCPGVRRDQRTAMIAVASSLTGQGGGTPITTEDDLSTLFTPEQAADIARAASLICQVEDFKNYDESPAFSTMGKQFRDTRDHVLQAHQAINIVSTEVLALGAQKAALAGDLDEAALATQLAAQLTTALPPALIAALAAQLGKA